MKPLKSASEREPESRRLTLSGIWTYEQARIVRKMYSLQSEYFASRALIVRIVSAN